MRVVRGQGAACRGKLRLCRALAAASTLSAALLPLLATPARADNPLGYQLLSAQDAAGLPHNHGALGLEIERARQITDDGMTFDILRVKQVHGGSAGAQAGLKVGDQLIAVDGKVFASLSAFAGYVGSIAPGTSASVDYIPANGGPTQAQRVSVVVGAPRAPASAQARPGLSTGTKVAIGVGAAALLGYYEMGGFSHHAAPQPAAAQPGAGQAYPQGGQPLR